MGRLDIDRRQWLKGAGAAAAAAGLLPRRALAAADHRFTQGAFEITVLSDGFITIPAEILVPEENPAERAATLRRVDALRGMVRPKANIPLIRTGNDLILVDIGAGHKYQPSEGRLADALAQTGVAPASITKVVFSHAHPDHIWATVDEAGALRFPNATYYVGAAEWDFWMDPDYQTRMPAALHDFARGAQRDLGAVRERVVMLKPGDDIVGGLRAVDTAGHTPGHLSFEIAGGEGLLITADVAVNEVVSFEHPDWRFGFDTLPDRAIATRQRLLDRAASERIKLLGYHWAYPGLGHAERKDGAYRFVAAG